MEQPARSEASAETEMATKSLPSVVAGAGGLSRYLEEIRKFPMLEPNEEYMLAKRCMQPCSDSCTPSAAGGCASRARCRMTWRAWLPHSPIREPSLLLHLTLPVLSARIPMTFRCTEHSRCARLFDITDCLDDSAGRASAHEWRRFIVYQLSREEALPREHANVHWS